MAKAKKTEIEYPTIVMFRRHDGIFLPAVITMHIDEDRKNLTVFTDGNENYGILQVRDARRGKEWFGPDDEVK